MFKSYSYFSVKKRKSSIIVFINSFWNTLHKRFPKVRISNLAEQLVFLLLRTVCITSRSTVKGHSQLLQQRFSSLWIKGSKFKIIVMYKSAGPVYYAVPNYCTTTGLVHYAPLINNITTGPLHYTTYHC